MNIQELINYCFECDYRVKHPSSPEVAEANKKMASIYDRMIWHKYNRDEEAKKILASYMVY